MTRLVAQIPWSHNRLIINEIETEYALRDINKPMGISEFKLTDTIPNDIKTKLPSIEELETKLSEKK